MARIPKKAGIHVVTIGGRRRRVRRLANGQVRFLPGSVKKSASSSPRASSPTKRAAPKRRRKTMPRTNLKPNVKAMLTAAAGGAAARAAAGFLGPRYGPAAGTAITGVLTKNDFLQHMGGYQLGNALSAQVGIGQSGPAGLI